MEWSPPDLWTALADYLKSLVASLPEKPTAILLVSAHWETPHFTVGATPRPGMIFDYYGFPAHTYQLSYPAPGDPALARRTRALLSEAGHATAEDGARGFDHGVFVPMLLVEPAADIPIATLSLRRDHDATAHLEAGKALAPLRDEGVLILGSGMSFHNMRAFQDPSYRPVAMAAAPSFDDWLTHAASAPANQREALLRDWAVAPGARVAQPPGAEEHLLPLMVAAGASDGPGRRDFHDSRLGVSAFRFD